MWGKSIGRAIAILLALSVLNVVAAQEPWTDPQLSVRTGLDLWLDASRAANALSGSKPLADGDRLPVWRDGSGHQRHVSQDTLQRQPKLVRVATSAAADAGWVVRFDGEDDYLRGIATGHRLTEFTLFAVAAPHSNPGQFRAFLALNELNRKDFETGLNLDMNAQPSVVFGNLNLEGRGFGG